MFFKGLSVPEVLENGKKEWLKTNKKKNTNKETFKKKIHKRQKSLIKFMFSERVKML